MYFEVQNIGRSIEGNVFDCSKKYLQKLLSDYDKRLYIKWNPNKNKGYGCWEIRVKPTKLTAVYKCNFNGSKVFSLEAVESDLVHHVLDLPYLTPRVLEYIKEIDAWNNKNLIETNDDIAERQLIAQEKAIEKEFRYLIKQNRKYFKEMQEYIKSGVNPAYFFTGKYNY